MTCRFYIGKKDQGDLDGNLDEWIDEKIPSPPPGMRCECDKDKHAHESEPDGEVIDCPALAATYLFRIEGDGRVCYSYVCWDCGEATASDDYLADQDYPVTGSGYAVSPKHCAG